MSQQLPAIRAHQRTAQKAAATEDYADALPSSGEYWQATKANSYATEGVAYLVQQVHVIDGEMHSVELAVHPREQRGSSWLIGEFLDHFRRVSAEEARTQEIADTQAKIEQLQRQLAQPPEAVNQKLIGATPTAIDTNVGSLIASGLPVSAIAQQMQARTEIMQAHAKHIQEVATTLGNESKVLANYFSERAKASIAEVKQTIEQAEHIEKGVATLGLYAGEGVELEQLVEGKPASTPGPISIYQRRLHLDEELLCKLDEGGADYKDISTLAQRLKADSTFRNLLLPDERSIVLMRPRRHDAQYTIRGLEDAYEAIIKNMANKENFLLVRNGEQIYGVWAELALDGLERLFPRSIDLDEIYRKDKWWGTSKEPGFHGIESEQITVADLEYVERRGKFETIALQYRRVLTLLWGLDNRLQLFGEFYDRTRHPSMLSMAFQSEHMRFVADEEEGLPENRKPLKQIFDESRQGLVKGSRVIVRTREAMNSESCPGAVTYDDRKDRESFLYYPCYDTIIGTVTEKDGEPAVRVETRHRHKNNERTFYIKLDSASRASWLNIDQLTADELQWYLNSRTERANYLEYAAIFKIAIQLLRKEEQESAEIIREMTERAGGPSQKEAVMEAWAQAAITRNHEPFPTDIKEAETAKRQILAHAATIASGRLSDKIEKASKALYESLGEERLAVRAHINGSATIITKAPDTEKTKAIPFPWDFERVWSAKGTTSQARWHEPHRLQKPGSDLEPYRKTLELPWPKATPNEVLDLEYALRGFTHNDAAYALKHPLEIEGHLTEYYQAARSIEKGFIRWMAYEVPLILGVDKQQYSNREPLMVMLEVEPIALAAQYSDKGRRIAEGYIRKHYKHADKQIEDLSTRSPVRIWQSRKMGKQQLNVTGYNSNEEILEAHELIEREKAKRDYIYFDANDNLLEIVANAKAAFERYKAQKPDCKPDA